jgi:hypothetical protein
MTTFTSEDRANADTCLVCGAPAEWTRHTQFAGNHPYCEEHAKKEDDFGEDDSYTFWTSKRERQAKLQNIISGANQQGDDDKDYREIPMTTINGPTGKPYLSVINDDPLIKLRIHNYDDIYDRGIYFTFDKRALTDLIKALEQYENY